MRRIFSQKRMVRAVSAALTSARINLPLGTQQPVIDDVSIPILHGLPASPIRILHLSDFHASPAVPLDYIDHIVGKGLTLSPDLICLTGDFVTGRLPDSNRYVQILRRLSEHALTLASFGNHDGFPGAHRRGGYSDTSTVEQLLRAAGIRPLLNESLTITIAGIPLKICGLGDLWARMFKPRLALEKRPAPNQPTTIVLSHNPDTKEWLRPYQWQLMLSGHTHGGQIRLPLLGAPFAPVRDKRFVEGLHEWQGRYIYVTRGVGNLHGLRINCRPQISILNLSERCDR